MTQSVDCHNPLIFCSVSVSCCDGGGSGSEQKDKLDAFEFFRKFLVFGSTRLQWWHTCILTSGTKGLKHISRNTNQFLEPRLSLEHITNYNHTL